MGPRKKKTELAQRMSRKHKENGKSAQLTGSDRAKSELFSKIMKDRNKCTRTRLDELLNTTSKVYKGSTVNQLLEKSWAIEYPCIRAYAGDVTIS